MPFVNLFYHVVWAILERPKWDVSICLQLPVTVVHALHSWILCNCKGPLLNSVPGNLIFTAAPDRNHLAVLIRLYWNWKIAAAVYIVLNSISSLEFSVVWLMSLRHFWATLKTGTASTDRCEFPKTSQTVWKVISWRKKWYSHEVDGPLLMFSTPLFCFHRTWWTLKR